MAQLEFTTCHVAEPRTIDPGTIDLRLDDRALTHGSLTSRDSIYTASRVNYRIYLESKDRYECVPLIDEDTYILDWGFTPDSTKLVFADETSGSFYVYETSTRQLLFTVKPRSFSEYDGMCFKTQLEIDTWSYYDVRYLVYLSNTYAILINAPGHFILLNLSTGATTHYQSDHINHALDITLSDDMKLQFTKVTDFIPTLYTAYLI